MKKEFKELKELLESIPRTYEDFVRWGCFCCETDEELNKLINFIKTKEDVTTSDVLEFHYEEIETKRNKT